MKQFNVPLIYRSPLIVAVKNMRKQADKMKKDFSPTFLNFGAIQIYLARHFGFCYGVENAIEIAFKTVEENKGKRIFLLSEMIHNPHVNNDLLAHGVSFLQDTLGNELIPLDSLTKDDIVIIPAFGTTLQMEAYLNEKGIETHKYNTTCPFVEKVWNRSEQIASKGYTVIIHGKPTHEETKATFSHAASNAPSIVINDFNEAKKLALYITGKANTNDFYKEFEGRYSLNFNAINDLKKIGVVNQTTMLASDTQGIADYLKDVVQNHYNADAISIQNYFADTRDTLCYATNDNQTAVYEMLNTKADFAIIVGGYNSSNTSHLVELCEQKLPSYFISDTDKILSNRIIKHFDLHKKEEKVTEDFLPQDNPTKILITSGASCPDAMVEAVIEKLLSFYPEAVSIEQILANFS